MNLCFTLVRYVLYQAGRQDLINIGEKVIADNQSNHSYMSSQKSRTPGKKAVTPSKSSVTKKSIAPYRNNKTPKTRLSSGRQMTEGSD